MTRRPIVVVGAGAIGGFVGARLAAAGEDIVFVDADPDHVEAIRQRGIHIGGQIDLRVRVPAFRPSELVQPVETVLLAVKARHTLEAIEPFEPLLDEEGCVVSLQNGLEERRIAERIGERRTIGAFITFGGHYAGPGEIVFGGEGSFRIGELDGSPSRRIHALAKLLGQAHPVEVTDRIYGYLWGKTALEAFYFASALTDCDVVDLLDRPDALHVLAPLVGEVARVARAEGSPCETIDGFDPNVFTRPETSGHRESWRAQRNYWDRHVAQRTGIWRDLAVHRRPTEVDAILGPVVDAADRHGLRVPHVQRLISLVHDAEAGRLGLAASALAGLSGE